MQTRIVALLVTLFALHGCSNKGTEFPRQVFADAYAAAIDQGFTEATLLSIAALGIENRGEPDLGARVLSNLPDSDCFEVDTATSDVATIAPKISGEACDLADREWTGSISFSALSETEFEITFDANVDDRPITGAASVVMSSLDEDRPAKGKLSATDLTIERIVSGYATEFDFAFKTVKADNNDSIEGYRISGTASWNNDTGNLWSSAMRDTLVLPQSNVPRSGTRIFNVDSSVEFRMLINALTKDSTDIVLRSSGDDLRICVDENDSDACPLR